jgi:hypothetical protein
MHLEAAVEMYAYLGYCVCLPTYRGEEVAMGKEAGLKRTSFFIDVRALRRARTALGASSDAETVRMSVERVAEMERFWRFMRKSRRKLKPGSIEAP